MIDLILHNLKKFTILMGAILVFALIEVSSAYEVSVHDSHGNRLSASVSCDAINGDTIQKSASIGFLLAKGRGKYIPSYALSKEALSMLADGYTVVKSPGLVVSIISIEPGPASIRLGDFNDVNFGVGIKARVKIHVPSKLEPGKREVVLTFPGVLRLCEIVGAEKPISPPTINFFVTNFESKESHAATRWWQKLLYGILCVLGAVVAIICIFAGGGLVALIVATLLVVGAFHFLSLAYELYRICH